MSAAERATECRADAEHRTEAEALGQADTQPTAAPDGSRLYDTARGLGHWDGEALRRTVCAAARMPLTNAQLGETVRQAIAAYEREVAP